MSAEDAGKPVREPISKKLRFKVFKRDKFTCQYCGGKAPEVLLQCDHIQPVTEGGRSDIMNLITSCQPCNAGKGARLLSDDSVVERQRLQIEELEERRQQLEMMLDWRNGLNNIEEDKVDAICQVIASRGQYVPNEAGRQDIRRWLKRNTVDELIAAVDEAFTIYVKFVDEKQTADSWNVASSKIPGVASISRQQATKPWLRDLFYIQGILRKRLGDPRLKCIDFLKLVVSDGVSVEEVTRAAKRADEWEEFEDEVRKIFLAIRASGQRK